MEKSLKGKVLVIGLDGATLDLIEPWVKDGRLPNLARLMKDGVYGVLESTIPPHTPVAWTSFMTGTKPGRHGIFDFVVPEPDSYRMRYINSTYRRYKPVWSIVSDNGGRVCVVNVPMTFPPDKVNGCMISGMGSPGTDSNFTYPEGLYDEIRKEGDYLIDIISARAHNKVHSIQFIDEIIRLTECHARVTSYLMNRYPWDLFVVVFVAPDRVQHDFWGYIDPNHRLFHSRKAPVLRDAIFKVYAHVDGVIGEIMDKVGEDVNIVLLSDHGFGPSYKVIDLNLWLEQMGYLKFKGGGGNRHNKAIARLNRFVRESKHLIPKNIRHIFKRRWQGKEDHRGGEELLLEWDKTLAYAEGTVGNIFLNLKGKKPMGMISEGEEAQNLCKEIIEGLLELKDPETGEKVIKGVYRKEEVFDGEEGEQFPDLLVICKDGYRCIENSKRSPFRVSDREIFKQDFWSGSHRMEGTLILNGPDIKKGGTVKGAKMVDVAPTILYLLGLPIPRSMDGRVLSEIFSNGYIDLHPPCFVDGDGRLDRERKDYSGDDASRIEERLRSLGYIE